MNLFQIGLLFSFPVQTYLLTCETGYWSIFIYVYMLGCVKCHVYFSTFVFANESWFFLCRVLSFIFYWFRIVRRKLTIPERWQAVGMYNGGLSHRRVADHFRVNHSIIVRLMQRFRQTGIITDHPRAGRPRKTTPREDPACPQVFSSEGTCTLLPSFLGVHPNFWGCNVPSNSSFGGTKKMNCIFSTQGRGPCCFFVNITQCWWKLFFSVWHWVRQEVGFCLTHGLCVCPTIFL